MVLLLWCSFCCHACNKLTTLITPVDNPLVHMKITNHMLCPVPMGEEARTDLSHQARSPQGRRSQMLVGDGWDLRSSEKVLLRINTSLTVTNH